MREPCRDLCTKYLFSPWLASPAHHSLDKRASGGHGDGHGCDLYHFCDRYLFAIPLELVSSSYVKDDNRKNSGAETINKYMYMCIKFCRHYSERDNNEGGAIIPQTDSSHPPPRQVKAVQNIQPPPSNLPDRLCASPTQFTRHLPKSTNPTPSRGVCGSWGWVWGW